jgi:2-keto-4-pentenoate hydratase/2-oxohepta-3-ene-1,7-dioic acid hydratase in catechol pathway
MKLLSYFYDGKARYGIVRDDGVIDLAVRLGDQAPTLRDLLAPADLSGAEEIAATASPDHGLGEIRYDLPVPNASKILCAGRNYRAYHEVIDDGKTPLYPSIFARHASSFAPHGENLLTSKVGHKLDYEGELVAVIGKPGRYIEAEDALDHVAGYTIMNEGTMRDWMKIGSQNTPAKGFDCSGGLGPWMVTADEITDPQKLHITTRRNGDVVQDSGTDMMIFDVAFLVQHIASFTTLQPGDLITTGSPGGSIAEQVDPQWLSPGEELSVEISGIGLLSNAVAEG